MISSQYIIAMNNVQFFMKNDCRYVLLFVVWLLICWNRYGEVVPLGPNYLPSYAAGVRAGIKELGPRLIDQDPTQLRVINAHMDYHLKGHPYVKSPIDMACWDILGKVGNFNIYHKQT